MVVCHGLPKEGRRRVARPHTGLLHREAPEHRVLSHASLLHGHNGPPKQDGMPMLRPLVAQQNPPDCASSR